MFYFAYREKRGVRRKPDDRKRSHENDCFFDSVDRKIKQQKADKKWQLIKENAYEEEHGSLLKNRRK